MTENTQNTENAETFEDAEEFTPESEAVNESGTDGENSDSVKDTVKDTVNDSVNDGSESGDEGSFDPTDIHVPTPRSVEELNEIFPESSKIVPPVAITLFGEMVQVGQKIGDVNATLTAQNAEMTDDMIVSLAANRSESNVVKAYKAMDRIRQQYEEAMKAVIKEMEPILNEGKLSKEALEEVKAERKSLISTFLSYKESLKTLTKFVADSELDLFEKVVSNMTAPGMRKNAGPSVKTSGSTGITRPRLNGGKVHVNGKQYETVSAAANAIASQTNSPFAQTDLVDIWCQSAGVQAWNDIPDGISEFTVNGGIKVAIEKLPKQK